MARNTLFHSQSREPFASNPNLQLDENHTTGPLRFLNPTRARLRPLRDQKPARSEGNPTNEDKEIQQGDTPDVTFKWRSRDNRKGRHTLVIPAATSASSDQSSTTGLTPSSNLTSILRNITRMSTRFPYWDISYLVAIIFTLGSVIWVINAFFVWLPLVAPATEFDGEISVAGGWTAWIGATVFEVGSVLLVLEAVNEDRAGCFGWAVERVWNDVEDKTWRYKPSNEECRHHHADRKTFVGSETRSGESGNLTPSAARSWQWWPSWHDLTTHYIRELGFLACFFQFLGASIFWISGFTALPGIQSSLTTQADLNGAYWVPQIVGGSGFIISSLCFMLETQKKWYLPAWNVLGWHIGAWNLIGALGFTLCGALGPAYGNEGALFESSLATFWGSWAFLIGSVVQWYESLEKYPVEVEHGIETETAAAGVTVGR